MSPTPETTEEARRYVLKHSWARLTEAFDLRPVRPGDHDANPDYPPKPSPYAVEAEAETVGDYAVTVDVLDDILDQLVTAAVEPGVRVLLAQAAHTLGIAGDTPGYRARLAELHAALVGLGVGRLAMDPADARALATALTRAADDGPDRCDLSLSTGERCDGYAAMCSRHGDAEVTR